MLSIIGKTFQRKSKRNCPSKLMQLENARLMRAVQRKNSEEKREKLKKDTKLQPRKEEKKSVHTI